MSKIKLSDICEIIKYGLECPACGAWIELDEGPGSGDVLTCEECESNIEVD